MSDSIACPKCHNEIRKSSKFCKYCGEPIKFCPNCSHPNTVTDKFCANCGSDITEVSAPEKRVAVPIKKASEVEDLPPGMKETDGDRLVIPDYMEPQKGDYQPNWQQGMFSPLKRQEDQYYPKEIEHPYETVKLMGFLSGPLPTSNVLVSAISSLAYGCALIAAAFSILALFGITGLDVLFIIGLIWASILILSAPFFGIYYVTSTWLYNTFNIKKPLTGIKMVINYSLSVSILSLLSLIIAPLFLIEAEWGIILGGLAFILYLIILTIVPLKAFLADLGYVKLALNKKGSSSLDEKGNS